MMSEIVERAFKLAVDNGSTPYDSIYLALAQKLHGGLASMTEGRLRAQAVGNSDSLDVVGFPIPMSLIES